MKKQPLEIARESLGHAVTVLAAWQSCQEVGRDRIAVPAQEAAELNAHVEDALEALEALTVPVVA